MEKAKITAIRDLLYRMTLIGFILFFAGIAFCMLFPGFLTMYSRLIFGTKNIANSLLILFGVWETLIITLFLIPALAIHWQYKK